MPQQLQPLEQPRSRHKQIRDHHDHPAPALSFGNMPQHIEDVGLLLRLFRFESEQNVVEMRPLGVRRDLRPNRFVERD